MDEHIRYTSIEYAARDAFLGENEERQLEAEQNTSFQLVPRRRE